MVKGTTQRISKDMVVRTPRDRNPHNIQIGDIIEVVFSGVSYDTNMKSQPLAINEVGYVVSMSPVVFSVELFRENSKGGHDLIALIYENNSGPTWRKVTA